MTRPTRYLVRIVLFLLIILALILSLREVLTHAFMANPGLDGVIIAVLVLGIIWNVHLTIRLFPEVRWVNILRQPREGLKVPAPPRLLAPMARLLRARREKNPRLAFSTQTTSAMLDSLESRMDEGREISRYITQLLVFLGLLGTFYGLILTVRSVADVISAMPSGGVDMSVMFDHVKAGLSKPLGGMSTAFSASMFGLAGSLILGFLDLTTGQAQNRFANEIEEWLADLTFLDTPATEGDDGPELNVSPRANAEKVENEMVAALGAWMPQVQDFMRITTENVTLLQQNLTALRRVLENDSEERSKALYKLQDMPNVLARPINALQNSIREGQIAILQELTEQNEAIRSRPAQAQASPAEPTPQRDSKGLQDIFAQLHEQNRATLVMLETLNAGLRERYFVDPAITQLLQEIARQLASLRNDMATNVRHQTSSQQTSPSGYEEG